jgi:carboxymethylenebutenolidase
MRVCTVLLSIFIAATLGLAQEPLAYSLTVPASPLQCYNAMTVDWQIRQWSDAVGAVFDARPEGAWRIQYSSGRIDQGSVLLADRGQRLVFSQLADSATTQVSMIFRDLGDSTEITIVHTLPRSSSAALRDTVATLWQRNLAGLSRYLTNFPGGYLAIPRGQGPFSAVLVLHDRFGLNRTTRGYCDSLANQGYVALAVDMFRGEVTGDVTQAARYLEAVRPEQTTAAVLRGLESLKSPGGRKIGARGVWGIGFGASQAVDAAAADAGVRACVIWQGTELPASDRLSRIACPVLGIFADPEDQHPRAEIGAFSQALMQAGIRSEVGVYPGGREFADPAYGQTYSQFAVDRAYGQTLTFFAKNLTK